LMHARARLDNSRPVTERPRAQALPTDSDRSLSTTMPQHACGRIGVSTTVIASLR
jgi:hypothetical protein